MDFSSFLIYGTPTHFHETIFDSHRLPSNKHALSDEFAKKLGVEKKIWEENEQKCFKLVKWSIRFMIIPPIYGLVTAQIYVMGCMFLLGVATMKLAFNRWIEAADNVLECQNASLPKHPSTERRVIVQLKEDLRNLVCN